MTNERDIFNDDGHELPPELEQIASDLYTLGSVQRGNAPADLEERLLNVVQDPSARTRLVHDSHDRAVPVRHQRRVIRPWQLQLAAAVTLLIVIAGVWVGQHGRSTAVLDPDQTSLVALESEIEEWLSVASIFEAEVEQEIDLLFAETGSFSAGLSELWTLDDIFEEGDAL